MSARKLVKRLAEGALVHSGAAALARRRLGGRSLVLAYHNVVPDNGHREGDLPNHLPLAAFEAQLELLSREHEVVSLENLLTAESDDRQSRVAITFDDAYRGALLLGIPALQRRNLPCTVFVTPGLLGGHEFWWDELASPSGGLSREVRTHAIEALEGDGEAIRTWASANGVSRRALSCPYRRSATAEELKQAAARPGVSLGAHTWSHPALTRVPAERLAFELHATREWLTQQDAALVDAIAYPYGDCDERVMNASRQSGYRAGFRVDGGWAIGTSSNRFDIPRLNVDPGVSTNGFSLRLAGLSAR